MLTSPKEKRRILNVPSLVSHRKLYYKASETTPFPANAKILSNKPGAPPGLTNAE